MTFDPAEVLAGKGLGLTAWRHTTRPHESRRRGATLARGDRERVGQPEKQPEAPVKGLGIASGAKRPGASKRRSPAQPRPTSTSRGRLHRNPKPRNRRQLPKATLPPHRSKGGTSRAALGRPVSVESLQNCPFHMVARDHRDVVCGLNLRLVEGIIEACDPMPMTPSSAPSPRRAMPSRDAYCELAVQDVADALTVLRPVYDNSGGDGWVRIDRGCPGSSREHRGPAQ